MMTEANKKPITKHRLDRGVVYFEWLPLKFHSSISDAL